MLCADMIKSISTSFYASAIRPTVIALCISVALLFAVPVVGIIMLPLTVAWVACLIWSSWYKAWDAIQSEGARTTPSTAMLLLLVPFFNFYRVFQVTWGFCRDFNKIRQRLGLTSPRAPSVGSAIASALLVLGVIPDAIALHLVGWVFLLACSRDAVRAVNAASADLKGRRSPLSDSFVPAHNTTQATQSLSARQQAGDVRESVETNPPATYSSFTCRRCSQVTAILDADVAVAKLCGKGRFASCSSCGAIIDLIGGTSQK